MKKQDTSLAALLAKPRRFRHGRRCFKDIRLVTDDELGEQELAQVKALRRRGLKAHIYRDPHTGYEVGVTAGKNRTDRYMRRAAMDELAYAEFQGLIDFDLFRVIASEAKADRMERFYRRLDAAEGVAA